MQHPITIDFTRAVPRIDKCGKISVRISQPKIKARLKSTDTINWTFGGNVPEWQTMHPTHIIGIVIEEPLSGPSNMPGVGGLFKATDASSRFIKALWAGPSGKLNLDSFLFLSHESDWTLTIKVSALFSKSGVPKGKGFKYPYRIYFFSEGIGTWYVDPELDVMPEPDPDPEG